MDKDFVTKLCCCNIYIYSALYHHLLLFVLELVLINLGVLLALAQNCHILCGSVVFLNMVLITHDLKQLISVLC